MIDYIHSKYSNRIGILATTTNGTIIPKEKLCIALKNANVKVLIDDYRDNVILAQEKFESVNSKLLEYGIKGICNHVEHWLDILGEKKETNERILCARCEACDVPFISLKEQKIYGCNYCDYAQEASIIEENKSDYLDLKQVDQNERACITEFIMGYSQNGYYSFCKQCFGFHACNQKQIEVAEQY